MITFPCAKINLGLNIVSKRKDGYHNLETVFYPIPLTDALEIKLMGDEFPSDVPGDLKLTGNAAAVSYIHRTHPTVYSESSSYSD